MPRLFVLLQYLLPQRLLTQAAGALARSEVFAKPLIRLFIRRYRVDMGEALDPDPSSYRNFNEFFTRELKPGARPLADEAGAVLCPADGAVSELGAIDGERLLQAKGRHFGLRDLLGGHGELARTLAGGSFITIYLSPRDYHRVHMPLPSRLLQTRHIPGKLFSVNEASAELIPGLFSRNERLVSVFEGECGRFAVVMVGAMIVAGIRAVWDEPGREGRLRAPEKDFADRGPKLAAGAEMGRFELGSTAIALFPPGAIEFDPGLAPGKTLRMGQKIGQLLPKHSLGKKP
ncbi:MAG: archaetidylserine decarboxylase [Gammaproteobacteria bacterium]|nr:archaetidylserine decarboxylase [Gammaproteobacteria bacterium]